MNNRIVFRNAFLIDGRGGDPAPDATVVVEDGVIKEISAQAGRSASAGRDGDTIDLKGRTLMPGLIDAHVHPGNLELMLTKVAELPPAVFVHRVSRILENDINLGFTTLRDAGGLDWGFRAAVDQGLIRGPRLFLCVGPLTQTGGHGDKRGALHENHLPRNSLGVYPGVCDGPDEVRKAARNQLRLGADQIKVMAEGGVMSPTGGPGQPQFTVEELRAAVETAEAAGTYVMAHTYTPPAVQNCVKAGVRSIEHATLIDEETVAMIKDAGAILVPTLTVFALLASEAANLGMSDAYARKMKVVREGAMKSLEMAYRAGVTIASGTDIIGPLQQFKGRELALKAEVMTPMEAIVSATKTNAELLRADDRLGTVEAGKWADLIVVNGDPLKDLGLFEPDREGVALVMKQGEILKKSL